MHGTSVGTPTLLGSVLGLSAAGASAILLGAMPCEPAGMATGMFDGAGILSDSSGASAGPAIGTAASAAGRGADSYMDAGPDTGAGIEPETVSGTPLSLGAILSSATPGAALCGTDTAGAGADGASGTPAGCNVATGVPAACGMGSAGMNGSTRTLAGASAGVLSGSDAGIRLLADPDVPSTLPCVLCEGAELGARAGAP